jgi:hypothetical protein
MDNQKVLSDYARYYNVLQEMGRIKLSKKVIQKDLTIPKGCHQSGYKDIRENEFDGSFIDFLCLVSLRFLLFTGGLDALFGDKYPEDIVNSLRLIMKKPNLIFEELSIKSDKKMFLGLAELFFEKSF